MIVPHTATPFSVTHSLSLTHTLSLTMCASPHLLTHLQALLASVHLALRWSSSSNSSVATCKTIGFRCSRLTSVRQAKAGQETRSIQEHTHEQQPYPTLSFQTHLLSCVSILAYPSSFDVVVVPHTQTQTQTRTHKHTVIHWHGQSSVRGRGTERKRGE